MTQALTAKGGMADLPRSIGVLAMTAHRRDPDPSRQTARATSCGAVCPP
jgi:hypothetical protein